MKKKSFLKLLGKGVVCALVAMFFAAPTMGAGPFIEYQDVPHYVSGEGWCLKGVWYYNTSSGQQNTSSGQQVFNSQIIC